MKIIKSAALILAAAMTLTLTACKPGRNETTENRSDGGSSTSSNSSETFLDKASKFLEADGRGYGKEHTAEMGETLENEFFSLKVSEAYRYSSMGDYVPDEGYDYVAVNITVKNIFTDKIPVGNYDYVLRWGDGDDNSFEAYDTEGLEIYYDFDLFPDDYELSVGASKSGYVIFQAPSDSTGLQLEYVEVYDDDFEGNTYRINLGDPDFAADDRKPPESKNVEGEIGDVTTEQTTTAPQTQKPVEIQDTETTGQKNAVRKAKDYTQIMAFSREGLIEQLEYEGFTNSEATYGADNCGADWNEQAVKQAKSYLKYMAFSYDGIVEQLEYEGFTHEQAVYGADNCGLESDSQALEKAKSYLSMMPFSYSGLIEQLEYEGFSHEDAVLAADNCGADWNEQAAKKAKSYLDYMSFSKQSLIDQLEYEGFTHEQAVYGATANGY